MYLNVSSSLPINSNPGWVFPRLIFKKGVEDMLNFATKFTEGIIKYKESLEMNTLEIEMSTSRRNKQPLCMKQYYRLLNFYRKPGIVKDEHIDFYSSQVKDEEIIVVMIKSHIYKIKVKVIGEWISLQNIYSHFWSVYNDSRYRKELNMDEKVQLLTTCNRRKWGSYYANMICNEKNASNFKDISRSLLIICFDETETLIGESKNENNIFRQILCGDGPFSNGCNRWFDKTLQLIINPNGINGICFEHSPMEGVAVLKTLQNVLYTINQSNEVFENKLVVIDCPMEWQLNDDIKNGIIDAKNNFVKLNADIDIEIYQFTKYGKDYIKSLNFSPDTFIQMTLQLTYYRLNGTLCSSYESGSTRRFLNGRVDCIRSSHLEALYWVESMLNSSIDKCTKLENFKSAMERQYKIMYDNIMGYGVDIPLLGFKKAAELAYAESGTSIPFFFECEAFKISNHFKLSSSQIPIDLPNSYMGYGPVVSDGYGAAYNISNDCIIIVLSSFFSCGKTSSKQFIKAFETSLYDIEELFN
ncbi:choline O-acetyltransferase isoform X2 [Lepeophtheirus salmonis]